MPNISGILFDKDGTLFDFQATWGVWTAWVLKTLADGDAELENRMAQSVGFDLKGGRFEASSLVIAGTPLEIAQALAGPLGHSDPAALLATLDSLAAATPQVEVTPLAALFSKLKARGLDLGIATNDSEAPARAHLEAANVTRYLDFIVGSDSGYGGKPEAGQLHGFCTAMSLAPEQCMMVGDSTHDLGAGRAAGFYTVGVLTGPATHDVLQPLADVVLPSIAELPGHLDQIAG
ncbi:HAD family hydrolase [Algirhabdus cladophorae]|uniref:HAD family hydrolase n=1 Tax=Algirhabdus cladophorae TaxID=3377108 RepID=UPI003B846F3B